MTLAEFSASLDVPAKWVLNALATLGLPPDYSVDAGKRFAVAHALIIEFECPLSHAMTLARVALSAWRGGRAPITLRIEPDSCVTVEVDVFRILASFHVRRSVFVSAAPQRQRGRPPAPAADALEHAGAWGLDLTLLRSNLMLTQAQRIAQLDAMTAFHRNVRRVAEAP